MADPINKPRSLMWEPIGVRLYGRLVANVETGCILWIGGKDKDGYGKIKHNGKYCRTHRVAWELVFGDIPRGMLIQHSCDNPPCCNINHLSLGTPLSNMQDKVRKGRLMNQYINKTHCKKGHEYLPGSFSIGYNSKGAPKRRCKKCYQSYREKPTLK